jgi:diguanylate cyclase (GGDEF)-like protein/PAS domain S-box-containing protein
MQAATHPLTSHLPAHPTTGTALDALLAATSDAVLLVDMLGHVVQVNPSFVNRFGYQEAEMVGTLWHALVASREDVPALLRSVDEVLITQRRWQGALWVRKQGGEVFQAALTVSRWQQVEEPQQGGGDSGYLLLLRQPGETREAVGRDPLTGLKGFGHLRNCLSDLLKQQRDEAAAYTHLSDSAHADYDPYADPTTDSTATTTPAPTQPALLLIALERFEDINARFGWSIADRVLQSLALRLRALIPSDQVLARVGGDRFGVILSYVEDKEEASAWADTLLAQIEEPFEIKSHKIQLSGHVGVAVSPPQGVDAGTMLLRAEQALEAARRTGQAGWRRASSRVMLTPVNGVSAPQLLRAIANDEFVVLYQPRVALKTGRVVAVETLVRWQHPDHGLLPPSQFITQAERAGLLGELGERLLGQAIQKFSEWRREHAQVRLSVTVVLSQLLEDGFCERLQAFLISKSLPASALEIDFAADIFAADSAAQAVASLRQLSHMGIALTISEVGRAPLPVTEVAALAPKLLKLDAQLVLALTQQERAQQVVKALLSMGRALGMTTAAAGVEDPRQVDLLRADGCDEALGYLFGRPMTSEQLSVLMRKRR